MPSWTRAVIYTTVTSPGQEVSLWTERVGNDAVKRVIGCAMIFAMPEEGINEALASLRDILEFSYEATHGMLPPPVAVRRSMGRIVGTTRRPDLVISE